MTPRPTVLFLHAFPLDSRMWAGQRDAVAARGFGVAAPDLPGEEPEATVGAWAEKVLADVRGSLVPVGVSMGGYLAFELWRRAPGRIVGLVLADTRAGAETPESRAGRDEMIALVAEEGAPALWERLHERLFAPAASPDVVERARAIALEQPVTSLVAALEAIRDRPDSFPVLPSIDVPVLVLVGEDDRLTPPSEVEAMADALLNARLARIAGSGHLPPLERPDEFNRLLLAFLEQFSA